MLCQKAVDHCDRDRQRRGNPTSMLAHCSPAQCLPEMSQSSLLQRWGQASVSSEGEDKSLANGIVAVLGHLRHVGRTAMQWRIRGTTAETGTSQSSEINAIDEQGEREGVHRMHCRACTTNQTGRCGPSTSKQLSPSSNKGYSTASSANQQLCHAASWLYSAA